ncbi:unnamed protein product [Clavelina lepadiformis]|uniref:ZU5 domain-containing protein n=1 Tax=Clavelina lepadiformis TaxID=159417 RepID=A0ABP0GCL6_CLALP
MQQPPSTLQGHIASQLPQTLHETYEPLYQDQQQQFNLNQSTSSSSATVTENPTASITGQSESQAQNKGFVRKEIKETPQEYIPYRARAAIGKNGGRVQFGGCEIIIPPKALKDYVYFTFTLRYEFNKENENKILATPVLHCVPSEQFQKDVTITLPTCYSLKGSCSDKYQLKTKKRDYSGPNDQTILNYGHFAIKSFDEFKMEISEADAASKRLLFKFYKGSQSHPGLPTIVWEIVDNFEKTSEQKQQFEVRITNGQDLTLQMKNENGCVIASQHIENKELFQTSCIKLMYSHTVQEGIRDMFEYNILDKKDIIMSGQFSLESLDCRDKSENSDHEDDSSSCSDDGDDSDTIETNGFSEYHMDEAS